MCKPKQKIHMLEQLWPVIKAQKKVSTGDIQNAMTTSKKPPRFFMYIANWCENSRRAFNHIQTTMLKDIIKNKSDYFTVVSTSNKGTTERLFACPEKPWTANGPTLLEKGPMRGENNVLLQQLLGCWDLCIKDNTIKDKRTWPQVFIHIHPEWYYVGGADCTVKLTPIAANMPVSGGGSSDLIHLLPMATKEAGNQPTQLKF